MIFGWMLCLFSGIYIYGVLVKNRLESNKEYERTKRRQCKVLLISDNLNEVLLLVTVS